MKEISRKIVSLAAVGTAVILAAISLLEGDDLQNAIRHPAFLTLGIVLTALTLASVFFVRRARSRLLHLAAALLMVSSMLMFVTDTQSTIRVLPGDKVAVPGMSGPHVQVHAVRVIDSPLSDEKKYETDIIPDGRKSVITISVNKPWVRGADRLYQSDYFLAFDSVRIRYNGTEYDLAKDAPRLVTADGRLFTFAPAGVYNPASIGPAAVYRGTLKGGATDPDTVWYFTKAEGPVSNGAPLAALGDFAILSESFRTGSVLLYVRRPFFLPFAVSSALFCLTLAWSLFFSHIRVKTRNQKHNAQKGEYNGKDGKGEVNEP